MVFPFTFQLAVVFWNGPLTETTLTSWTEIVHSSRVRNSDQNQSIYKFSNWSLFETANTFMQIRILIAWSFDIQIVPFHPMCCNDITVVATLGNLSRFQDLYTRDQSTPREDSIVGGQDDLTAAVAFEDPVTNTVTAIFRKKLTGMDKFAKFECNWDERYLFFTRYGPQLVVRFQRSIEFFLLLKIWTPLKSAPRANCISIVYQW